MAAATARDRPFLQITMLCLLISSSRAAPDKLSPNQIAPAHARSSAGRALGLPISGQTPANVGRLKPGGKPPAPAPAPAAAPQEDGVQREEMVSFKEVNGETVRVVVGNYAYQSPEGLPVSFKYMADENGNKASFTIGAAAGGSGSRPASSGSQRPGGGGGGAGGGGGGGGGRGGGAGGPGAGGAGKGGGAGGDGDRKYLPPT